MVECFVFLRPLGLRLKGSHVVYEKDGVEEIMTFQDRKGMVKPYQVKQLLAVIEKYRLGERE